MAFSFSRSLPPSPFGVDRRGVEEEGEVCVCVGAVFVSQPQQPRTRLDRLALFTHEGGHDTNEVGS